MSTRYEVMTYQSQTPSQYCDQETYPMNASLQQIVEHTPRMDEESQH